jgi:hypothetical protein
MLLILKTHQFRHSREGGNLGSVNASFVALNNHSWTPTLTGYQPTLV